MARSGTFGTENVNGRGAEFEILLLEVAGSSFSYCLTSCTTGVIHGFKPYRHIYGVQVMEQLAAEDRFDMPIVRVVFIPQRNGAALDWK